ncbi:hypothetical protein KKB18_11500 [bacterium]|nr:hypothetical protein [bacterium]
MRQTGFFLVIVLVMNLTVIANADIWTRHVNSNRCNQILSNDKELWVRPGYGGLVCWDIATGEYTQFYDTRGLLSCEINDMVYDDQGRLLAYDGYGNMLRYEDETFKVLCKTPYPSPSGFAFADSKIMMGYRLQNIFWGLYYWDSGNWIKMDEFSDYLIYALASDFRGGFWASVQTKDGEGKYTISSIIYYKDGEITSYSSTEVTGEDMGRSSITTHITLDKEGTIWVCLYGGVAWYDGDKWQKHFWTDEIEGYPQRVKNVIRDNDGIVWIATGEGDLRRFDGQNWTKSSEYDGTKVIYVENNLNGGIWIGTNESLELFSRTKREEYKIDNLLPISNTIGAIDKDPDDNILCGDSNGDFAMLDRNTSRWQVMHAEQFSDAFALGGLNNIVMSKTSGMWTVFSMDVLRFFNGEWISYFNQIRDICISALTDIAEGPDGSIYLGLNESVSYLEKWNGTSWETFETPFENKNFKNEYCRNICSDHYGNLWIVSNRELYNWDGKEWYSFSLRGTSEIFDPLDITSVSDGTVWIGFSTKILVVSKRSILKEFTKDDGLPFDPNSPWPDGINIYSIKEAPDSTVWSLGRYGIAHYDGFEFKSYYFENAMDFINGDLVIDSSGRMFISSSFGLTEFIPTSVTLKMSLSTNNISYKKGDNFSLQLSVENQGPDEAGDLYFVMLAPDGTIYSALDWSKSIHPATSNITIPTGYTLPLLEVVNVTLPSSNPPISIPGKYYFAIGLADTDTTYFRSKAITLVEIKE